MPHTAYEDSELDLHPGWDEGLDPNIRKEIRQARVTVKENEALKDQVATYERERTLAEAGIPRDKRGLAFAQLYDGPLEAEPAKKAYEELFGPITPDAGTAGGTGDPNLTAEQRIAAANAAGTSEGSPGTVDLGDAIRNAKDAQEVKTILAAAASQGVGFAPGQYIPRLPEDQ